MPAEAATKGFRWCRRDAEWRTGARTFPQVIGYRPPPLTVPTFANSWCRPRSDIPASYQALVPLFAKNPPYRSNGEPVGIAWRGCCEGVSRVFDALARAGTGK